MKTSSLLNAEFKTLVRWVLNYFSENFNKEIGNKHKRELVINEECITKMENTSRGINSRLNEAKDQISNLEDKVAENTQLEQRKESKKRR